MIYFSNFDSAGGSSFFFLGSKTDSQVDTVNDTTTSLTDIKDTSNNNVALQEGDLIVAFHAQSDSGTSVQGSFAADMKDPSYSDAMTEALWNNHTSFDTTIFVSYKFMGSTPDTTMVLKGAEDTNGSHAVTLMAFRGAHATPFEATYSTSTGQGGTSIDPPALSPSGSGVSILVYGAMSMASGTAPSLPSDLSPDTNKWRTVVADSSGQDIQAGAGIRENWTSGSFNPEAWSHGTPDSGSSWCAVTLALKPA